MASGEYFDESGRALQPATDAAFTVFPADVRYCVFIPILTVQIDHK